VGNIADPLGDRMKQYEAATRLVLPRRTYTVIRVDGKAFHTFLRHTSKPWDEDVVWSMIETAKSLCRLLDGAVLAYTQSDEISVVMQDFENNGTQAWFGGVVQKMTSIAAATATAFFTREYRHHFDMDDGPLPVFDARVFTIPDVVEVANYLVWRQRDCMRNSVLALAQSVFSHREMQGESVRGLVQRLRLERGIDWEKDVPLHLRQGTQIVKETYDATPNDADPLTLRTRWIHFAASEFRADGSGSLAQLLPAPRSLT
jgi:tRNA(His) guanylyltransferase